VLLVCRYRLASPDVAAFTGRVRRCVELLTAQPGCRRATFARATDAADAWLLVVEFDSVPAYRRALSPFEVREHVVPLLSDALTDEPATFEPLLTGEGGTATERHSVIAEDAGTVRLGEAAGPASPR
jgi:Antibiotic biosynthesis monooxygenase